ncbi:MAG: hypothetical protein CEN88_343 [Candidatus Berkelbacteria bacterium Licking1014_2]|uniref:Uncharacterized protein n=1 Tax=Candidatus Berkelbacteria bacterium Licking1014_2 TaxID=2017146 RepID=A0A554LUE5_9BACT|nr:MAG: hypothetical protein CEN88_343 [Candidatus Berkelbacteria bacterium Licking1014_2]
MREIRSGWNQKVSPGKHRRGKKWLWFKKFRDIARTVVNLVIRPKSPTGSAFLLFLTAYIMLVIYVHLNFIFWIIVVITARKMFPFLAGKIIGYRRKLDETRG